MNLQAAVSGIALHAAPRGPAQAGRSRRVERMETPTFGSCEAEGLDQTDLTAEVLIGLGFEVCF